MSVGENPRRGPSRRLSAATVMVTALLLAGCGDDDASPQERYCDAGESLRDSVGALTDLDVVSGGTDALDSALGEVRDDLGELQDAASDTTEDDVDAFGDAVDEFGESLSTLGDDVSRDNAAAVGDALSSVASAAQDVFGTLSDC